MLNVGFCVLALSARDREKAVGEGGGMVEEAEEESKEELRIDNFEEMTDAKSLEHEQKKTVQIRRFVLDTFML